jgi:UDP:flavonoid glycosyltransferase YjiC (YdhE family)
MHQWMHSPQLVIGFFPEWFAAPQPDWPPHTHLVGFPLWDAGSTSTWPPGAQSFLDDGEAPVVFTPGSAAATMRRFFAESATAVRELGVRAMFVTNFPEQIPGDLPPGVNVFGYVPFSELLPRARLLVYHGGIGTLAQTIKAAIPHVVVPNGHDQFDNGWRIERLGLGRCIPQTQYRGRRVTEAIRGLLRDDQMPSRCRDVASRVDAQGAVTKACELIETLGRSRMAMAR